MLVAAWFSPPPNQSVWYGTFTEIIRAGQGALAHELPDAVPSIILVWVGSVHPLECVIFDAPDNSVNAIKRALHVLFRKPWMVGVQTDEVASVKPRLRLGGILFGRALLLTIGFLGVSNARDWQDRLGMPVVCPRDEDEEERIGRLVRGPSPSASALFALVEPIARGN